MAKAPAKKRKPRSGPAAPPSRRCICDDCLNFAEVGNLCSGCAAAGCIYGEGCRALGRARDEELWAAMVTADESCELVAELTAALAVLHGEPLTPCVSGCEGHLGEKASAAMNEALQRWEAMRRENDRLMRQLATNRAQYDALAAQHAGLLRDSAVDLRTIALYQEQVAAEVEATGAGALALAT